MVGHDNIGERLGAGVRCLAMQCSDDESTEVEIGEETRALARDGGYEIDLPADRRSSTP